MSCRRGSVPPQRLHPLPILLCFDPFGICLCSRARYTIIWVRQYRGSGLRWVSNGVAGDCYLARSARQAGDGRQAGGQSLSIRAAAQGVQHLASNWARLWCGCVEHWVACGIGAGWCGLYWVGFGGLGLFRLGWARSGWVGLGWVGLSWVGVPTAYVLFCVQVLLQQF